MKPYFTFKGKFFKYNNNPDKEIKEIELDNIDFQILVNYKGSCAYFYDKNSKLETWLQSWPDLFHMICDLNLDYKNRMQVINEILPIKNKLISMNIISSM